MTSREEHTALQNLTDLLASDITQAEPETLIDGVRDAELAFAEAQKWSGRLVAELVRRGDMSWSELARATGVARPTLVRRAKPFLPADKA